MTHLFDMCASPRCTFMVSNKGDICDACKVKANKAKPVRCSDCDSIIASGWSAVECNCPVRDTLDRKGSR
jgi:hypothetical protein